MGAKNRPKSKGGRFSTSEPNQRLVWIRAAGHCEHCGVDVTQDFRTGKAFRWAEVAHILPASSKGPRSTMNYDDGTAKRLTNDPNNLILLCPSCHRKIDIDADGYPRADLSRQHYEHVERIRFAARRGETQRATGLIILGGHFATENVIRTRDLADVMLSEGLWADGEIQVLRLSRPGDAGRDELYWRNVERNIDDCLRDRLIKRTTVDGDPPNLAVVGLADIPSLIRVGRQLGDRSNRFLYSRDRSGGLRWTDPDAPPPTWSFTPPASGDGPIALVIALSAELDDDSILQSLPNARIARFSVPLPEYCLVRNRNTLNSFRSTLQPLLSQLEASTSDAIHLFAAVPAAIAIEFGALLSTQHAHPYRIYDRGDGNRFVPTMDIGPRR